MRKVYDEYFAGLVADGMSEADATRSLACIRDWSKNAFALFNGLDIRVDDYAGSSRQRMDSAEAGTDMAEYWLCLQSGGATEEELAQFTCKCELRSPEMIKLWLVMNNLVGKFAEGREKIYGIALVGA